MNITNGSWGVELQPDARNLTLRTVHGSIPMTPKMARWLATQLLAAADYTIK